MPLLVGGVLAIAIVAMMIRVMMVLVNDDDSLQYVLRDLLSALALVSLLLMAEKLLN